MFQKMFFSILLASLATAAHAAGRLHPAGEKISSIKIHSNGGFSGQFSTAHSDPDGCVASNAESNRRFYVPPTNPGKDALLSLVLAAKMSGSKITVYVAGCDANGPLVNTLDIL